MRAACRAVAVLAVLIGGVTFLAAGPASAATLHRPVWTAQYTGTLSGDSGATDEAVSPGGGTLFVTGYTGYSGQDGATGGATIAYDAATGAVLWTQATLPTGDIDTIMSTVAVSPDGSAVFASGYYSDPSDPSVFGAVTIAYDAATGATLWTRRYAGVEDGVTLAVSPDGSRLYVMTEGAVTLAYSTKSGRLTWASAAPNATSFIHAGTLSPDGSEVFMTGSILVSGNRNDYETVALDAATGATQWAKTYGTPDASNVADSVAVSPDGSEVYVAGYFDNGTGSDAIFAYDAATGATDWKKTQLPTAHGAMDGLISLAVTGSTLFEASAVGGGPVNPHWVIQARGAATGAVLWSAHYGTASQDTYPLDIAVSPDGSEVYVTGVLANTDGTSSYPTLAFGAANGAESWFADWDSGPVMTVAPDGSAVYVTGVERSGTISEFGTQAYRA
jgi:sugar lactone lactonase YvrE